jgi:replicative DNA helicase
MWDNLNNVSIERILLKALYTQPESIYDVIDVLGSTPTHFLDDNNRAAYTALLKLYDLGKEFSDYNLVSELGEVVGRTQATTHLVKIMSAMPTTKPLEVAYSIVDQSAKRRIYLLGDSLKKKAVGNESHQDIIASVDTEIREITQEVTTHGAKSVASIVEQFYGSIQKKINPLELTMHSSGIQEFDTMLKGGFIGGQFIILAARPSMGKSMLATQIALSMARQQIPTAIFSLEMTQTELLLRLLNQNAERDVVGDRETLLGNEAIIDSMLDMHNIPLHIDDSGRLDLITLKTKARRLIKNEDVKMIFIDYLQLMTGPQNNSREREVAELSVGLKRLAKELDIPIMCLAQLNRDVEKRDKKIPALSDLRESGSIEQDADVVMFIHRKKYYDENSDDTAQVIFAKNRSTGLTGTIRMVYDKDCGIFR